MPDYSIEKYIISNNRTLGYDDFYDFDRVKVAFIESDFDMDDDSANHFLCMKDLERFDVLDDKSRFYTEEGVLFVNVGRKQTDLLHLICAFVNKHQKRGASHEDPLFYVL